MTPLLLLLLQVAAPLPETLPPQSLPARGCAAFLWSRGPTPVLIAMAGADPAELRMASGGRTETWQRSAPGEGDAGFGFAQRTEYRLGAATATLELTLAARPDVAQGGAVADAMLSVTRPGADAVLIPVGGLVGCAGGPAAPRVR